VAQGGELCSEAGFSTDILRLWHAGIYRYQLSRKIVMDTCDASLGRSARMKSDGEGDVMKIDWLHEEMQGVLKRAERSFPSAAVWENESC
jgi:hypothetical protein